MLSRFVEWITALLTQGLAEPPRLSGNGLAEFDLGEVELHYVYDILANENVEVACGLIGLVSASQLCGEICGFVVTVTHDWEITALDLGDLYLNLGVG